MNIVKTGIYEPDIKPIIMSFSENFLEFPFFNKDIKKYGILENGMMLMISQFSQTSLDLNEYNILLTITGPNSTLNVHTFDQLQHHLPFKLNPAPPEIERLTNFMFDSV